MILSDYIPRRAVDLKLSARSKAEALTKLTNALLTGKAEMLRGAVMEQLLGREALESTAIGRGIALPHARMRELEDLTCAVGVSPKGIAFKAVDGEPVSLVFLICYPPRRQSTYLNFVASIASMLRDAAATDALRTAATADQVLALLDERSVRMVAPEGTAGKSKKAHVQLDGAASAPAEILLLARLDLCNEMLATKSSGAREIEKRIENIRSLVSPRVLAHYDRLRARGGAALVMMEGGVCQGCLVRLPWKDMQKIRAKPDAISLCPRCQRILYVP